MFYNQFILLSFGHLMDIVCFQLIRFLLCSETSSLMSSWYYLQASSGGGHKYRRYRTRSLTVSKMKLDMMDWHLKTCTLLYYLYISMCFFKFFLIEANLFVCFPVPSPAKNLFLFFFLHNVLIRWKKKCFNCSEINKRLPGPHFDPPSKEQVKTLMQVCFGFQIFC